MSGRNTLIAFNRGRADYEARNFVNPYTVRGLRTAWARGFRAAAQEHREAMRKAVKRTDADLFIEGHSA